MDIMRKLSLISFICCVFLLLGSCGQGPKRAVVGKSAPDFSLLDNTGKTWTLSELRGQVVFVNFWSTWCAPCREEMPSMQRLYEAMPKDKFKMLAILSRDDPFMADTFAMKHGITIPILFDKENKVGPQYGITGVPETYIIDKNGVLIEKFIGPARWDNQIYRQKMMEYINKQ